MKRVFLFSILFLSSVGCINQNIFGAKPLNETTEMKSKVNPSKTPSSINSNVNTISSTPPITVNNIEKTIFNGKVYDISGNPVDDAIVTATSLEPSIIWKESQKTEGGSYVFKNVPIGVKIEIQVTKNGWATRSRTEILKSNLSGAPDLNVFEFGKGFYGTDEKNLYAIQDEPEIVFMGINGKQATNSDQEGTLNIKPRSPDSVLNANLTGVNPNILAIELKFSEAINKSDIENYFRLLSTSNFNNKKSAFTIDKNSTSISFNWGNDDKSVTIINSKPILSNYSGSEAKYLIDFIQPFRDKEGKNAIKGRFFKFNESKSNDFHVFSVKNQEESVNIVSIKAIDGVSSNDIIKIKFSVPLEVIAQTTNQALLISPLFPNATQNQLWAMNTNNTNGNNATLLGFYENGAFQVVYVIGRLKDKDLQNTINNNNTANLLLSSLGNNSFKYVPSYYGLGKDSLKSVKLDKDTISLELTSDAFDKNDYIILSTSKNIHTGYIDQNNKIFLSDLAPILPNNTFFYDITAPSGKKIEAGITQQLDGFAIDGIQKTTVVRN